MSVKDYNVIAFDLRVDAKKIKEVVEDFGLFSFTEDGKYFYSESFIERMKPFDNAREQRRQAGIKSGEKRRNKIEISTTVERPLNEKGTTAEQVKYSKVKESKVKNNKEEIISINGKQKVISSTLYNSLQELLSDKVYIEAFAMNNHITLEQTEDFVKLFFVHLQNKNIHHKTKKDSIDHFANWIPFQLEKLTEKKQKKNDSNQRNSIADTEGQARKQAIVSRLQQAAAKCDNQDT